MNTNLEIFGLIGGLFLGIVLGGFFYFLFTRNRVSRHFHEALKIEFESTKVRLQTELLNFQKIIDEKTGLVFSKDGEIQTITQQLNQTLTNLEIANDRLQNVSAENGKLEEKIDGLEDNLSLITRQFSAVSANEKVLEESLKKERLESNLKEAEVCELRKITAKLTEEKAVLQANLSANEGKLATQKAEIEEIRQKSHLEFENIANRLLETKSEKFTAVNRENIENILQPLKSDLVSFKSKVEETYNRESKERFSLEREVKALIEQTNKVSNEANNLAIALKGQAKTQGNWGEMILERILEINGLVRGREYDVQHSVKNAEGNQQFLDVIVHLPDNRKLIIDSKVTLNAYERYCAAETEAERTRHLKDHIQALTNHIDQLSSKKYDEMEASPDFVMLFVSIEPAYLAAIQSDTSLWARAYSKKILLISPTNLMAAVKMVSDLWQRDNQSKNSLEIARQGEKLYDKFVGFLNSLDDIGNHLSKTQESYQKAVNQLKKGRGNLIRQAEKLKQLGVKSSKMLPSAMANYDDQSEFAAAESLNILEV